MTWLRFPLLLVPAANISAISWCISYFSRRVGGQQCCFHRMLQRKIRKKITFRSNYSYNPTNQSMKCRVYSDAVLTAIRNSSQHIASKRLYNPYYHPNFKANKLQSFSNNRVIFSATCPALFPTVPKFAMLTLHYIKSNPSLSPYPVSGHTVIPDLIAPVGFVWIVVVDCNKHGVFVLLHITYPKLLSFPATDASVYGPVVVPPLRHGLPQWD